MRAFYLVGLIVAALASPTHAVVEGRPDRNPAGLRQSVVWVENSMGELCSGALVRPDLVLTAAHCMMDDAKYGVVAVNRAFRPIRLRVIAAAIHPGFKPSSTPRSQPGVDLAVLKLEKPLGAEFEPFDLDSIVNVRTGGMVTLAGFGVLGENRNRTARTLRTTNLLALGSVEASNKVLIVADRARQAQTTGAGACRGDSGGPVLAATRRGYQLVGIVSWSSGALRSGPTAACGGLTAVTPVADHLRWIEKSIDLLDDL